MNSDQKSEALHELILSHISEVVFITDRNGTFTFVGPNANVIFGYSRQEIQQFGNIHHLLGENLFEMNQLESCGELRNLQQEITDKLGNIHHLLVNVKRVSIQNGAVLYTCRDITEHQPAETRITFLNAQLEQQVSERTAELQQIHAQFTQEIQERQRVEDALRKSEAQFRQLAENIDSVFWMITPDMSELLYVSPLYEKIWGRSCESFYQNPYSWFETIHPDDRDRIRGNAEQAAKSGYHQAELEIEYRIVRPDSRIRWIRARAFPIRDEAGNVYRVAGISDDITERKQAEIDSYQETAQRQQVELQLKESESRLNAIVNNTSDGILIVDKQGIVRFANPSAAKLFGRTLEQLLNYDFGEPILVGDVAELSIIRSGGEFGIGEMSVAQTQWQGEAVYIVSLRDITERRQAEEALRESEERFRQLADNIQNVFWLFNPYTEELLYISPAYETLWGRTCESAYATQSNWVNTLHPEDREIASTSFAQQLQGESTHAEYRIIRPDGEIRWISARTFPIKNEWHELYRIAGIAEDISERKQVEAQLQQYHDRLEELVAQRTTQLTEANAQLQQEILERQRAESAIHFQARLLDVVEHAIIATDLSGVIIYWNRFAEHLYGWLAREAVGHNILKITPSEASQEQAAEIMSCLSRGESWSGEFWVQRRDGTSFPALVTDSPIYNEGGQLMGLVGISFDITERKQAEEALRKANEELGITVEERTRDLGSAIERLQQEIVQRKQIEDALRASQARFAGILKIANDAIISIDAAQQITLFNQGAEKIFGYTAQEVVGQSLSLLMPTPYADTHRQDVVNFSQSAGEARRMGNRREIWGRRKDGSVFPAEASISMLVIAGEKVFTAILRDISHRKQAEEALQLQMNQDRLLTQISQHIRQSLNLDRILNTTVHEVRQLLQADRALIFRLEPDKIGIVTHESVSPGWNSTVGHEYEDEEFPVDCYQNYCQGKARIITDITLDETATCLLEYMQELGVKSRLAVPILHSHSGLEVRQNSELKVQNPPLWGLLIIHQCSHIRSWQSWEVNLLQQLATQVAIAIQQAELYRQLEIELNERKQAQTQLQQAKEAAVSAAAQSAAANRAKSEFLANMSHELRTPLNAILGFTQLMSHERTSLGHETHSLSPQQQEFLGMISRSGEHLLSLINDILSMSKIEAGRLTFNENSFDLYRLLDTLEKMFQLKAVNQDLQLIFERTADVPQYIHTDESKLRQVLMNLLENAIKFTPSGQVMLRVVKDLKVEGWAIEPSNTSPHLQPATLRFEVEDTGTGIAPEEIDSLFNPFVQTQTGRKSQSGTGLGLAISQRFVRMMGGEITVSSVLGAGTIFKFDVRVSVAPSAQIFPQPPQRQVIALAPHQPRYRILVVEDKLTNRKLLTNLLEPLGFEVREAQNGQEGVALWESWQPHLIWMDIRMPVMDGYEATQQIRAKERQQKAQRLNPPSGEFSSSSHPPVPTSYHRATVIIALTASAFEEERDRFLTAGCDDFVLKPFRGELIFEKISQHLGVCYLYEDRDSTFSSQSVVPQPPLAPEALAVMPADWIAQLNQAAKSLDAELMNQLIAQIPESNHLLAITLTDLIDDFRFDRIMELTQPTAP